MELRPGKQARLGGDGYRGAKGGLSEHNVRVNVFGWKLQKKGELTKGRIAQGNECKNRSKKQEDKAKKKIGREYSLVDCGGVNILRAIILLFASEKKIGEEKDEAQQMP